MTVTLWGILIGGHSLFFEENTERRPQHSSPVEYRLGMKGESDICDVASAAKIILDFVTKTKTDVRRYTKQSTWGNQSNRAMHLMLKENSDTRIYVYLHTYRDIHMYVCICAYVYLTHISVHKYVCVLHTYRKGFT